MESAGGSDVVIECDVATVRFGYLNGLRVLGVLAVVLYHVAVSLLAHPHALTGPASGIVSAAADVLWHGIDLLLVLSGFGLAYPALAMMRAENRTAFFPGRYLAKRLLRIYPTYVVAVLGWLTVPIVADLMQAHVSTRILPVPGIVDLVKQLAFLDGGTQFVNDSFWSLAVQVREYLLFPLLLVLWTLAPRGFVILGGLAALMFLLTEMNAIDVGMLPAFMLGIVAAEMRANEYQFERFGLLIAAIVGAAGALLGPFLPTHAPLGAPAYLIAAYTHTGILWQVAAFFIVIGFGGVRIFEGILSARWVGVLAAASFSIYLTHEPVVRYVVATYGDRLGPIGAAGAATAASLLVGLVFYGIFDHWVAVAKERLGRSGTFDHLLDGCGIPVSVVLGDAPPVAMTIAYAGAETLMPTASHAAPVVAPTPPSPPPARSAPAKMPSHFGLFADDETPEEPPEPTRRDLARAKLAERLAQPTDGPSPEELRVKAEAEAAARVQAEKDRLAAKQRDRNKRFMKNPRLAADPSETPEAEPAAVAPAATTEAPAPRSEPEADAAPRKGGMSIRIGPKPATDSASEPEASPRTLGPPGFGGIRVAVAGRPPTAEPSVDEHVETEPAAEAEVRLSPTLAQRLARDFETDEAGMPIVRLGVS